MKKIIFTLLTTILLSCSSNNKVILTKEEYNKLNNIPNPEYPKLIDVPYDNRYTSDDKCYIIVIDSCEYITYSIKCNTGLLTHKGNCKFCKQRNQTK